MLDMKTIYDRALAGWTGTAGVAKTGANVVYDKARDNPKATAVILLGTTLAAGAMWVLKEPQRLDAVRKRIAGLLPDKPRKPRTRR